MDGFAQLLPSVIIAVSAGAAFAAGRLIAWSAAKLRVTAPARIVVLTIAAAVALFFFVSPASRYALLLPSGFAAGFLTLRRKVVAPPVFDDDRG